MLGFQYKGITVGNNLGMKLYLLTNSSLLIVTEKSGYYY